MFPRPPLQLPGAPTRRWVKRPGDLDLWPFDLKSGVRVKYDVGYFCANFGLPTPLCSRPRPDVRDRQTSDVRRASSLNAPAYSGWGIIMLFDRPIPLFWATPYSRSLQWATNRSVPTQYCRRTAVWRQLHYKSYIMNMCLLRLRTSNICYEWPQNTIPFSTAMSPRNTNAYCSLPGFWLNTASAGSTKKHPMRPGLSNEQSHWQVRLSLFIYFQTHMPCTYEYTIQHACELRNNYCYYLE